MATTTQTSTETNKVNGVHESSYIARGPVTSTLSFYKPPTDGSKPFNYVEKPPEGQPQRNFGDSDIPIEIQDIRSKEKSFNLDTNAFAAFHVPPSAEKDFISDDSVKKNYYPEVERFILQNVDGAKRVLLFDHTIRRANPNATRAPVTRVHIDQTRASAEARVHHHLPDEASALLQGRVRIINVWRPINGAVESFPLAFADSTSVPDEAMVGIQHRYPDRTGETAAVKYMDGLKWHYWSGMENEERLMLQCYDSEKGARVPHTAFVDPRSPAGAKPRESIEVRALVFG